mmetsp:Transcript_10333/g.34210  ORF Transcript_10333/g.34210 Transcript_10333/m.34210 type:complete len:314 (-) Transcript_10333:595-1536(-)
MMRWSKMWSGVHSTKSSVPTYGAAAMSERAKPSVYVSPRSTKVISSCSAVGSAASAFWNCAPRLPMTNTTRRIPPRLSCLSTCASTGCPARGESNLGWSGVSRSPGLAAADKTARSTRAPGGRRVPRGGAEDGAAGLLGAVARPLAGEADGRSPRWREISERLEPREICSSLGSESRLLIAAFIAASSLRTECNRKALLRSYRRRCSARSDGATVSFSSASYTCANRARRSVSFLWIWKHESIIPRGANTSRSNSSSRGRPDSTSSSLPSTSVAYEYRQRSPGCEPRGIRPRRSTNSARDMSNGVFHPMRAPA